MEFLSTRGGGKSVSSAVAVATGLSEDGGLFVPETFPKLTLEEIEALTFLSYSEKASKILSLFLSDFSKEEIEECTKFAYDSGRFSHKDVAPIKEVQSGVHMLELWHGPTSAFKDMALQILPHLMRISVKKVAPGKEVVILVATSGDTGKAALEGFKDAEKTKILVFYPEDGVSNMQKLQMMTQEGENVEVCAVKGNFDDAQTGVKQIFLSKEVEEKLSKKNMMFSSANSINWGRLVPQIVYYFSGYTDLLSKGKIKLGDEINVVVPTGNFGNILAAYYAKTMGLPIKTLICASNKNNVLTDFINTGVYDRKREFYATSSPSMDILISSNLERLLYHLSGENPSEVKELMGKLMKEGRYQVSTEIKEKLNKNFYGNWSSEEEVLETIKNLFERYNYLCDTHTAVGVNVYDKYRKETGDTAATLIVSTANPYKFPESVLKAFEKEFDGDEFKSASKLEEITNTEIPKQLSGLKNKKIRFKDVCQKDEMEQIVYHMLDIS